MRVVIVAMLLSLAAGAQTPPSSKATAAFESKKIKVLAEAGQRHLRLGSWCRKQGLVPQATAQFLLGEKVAQGHNPGASWLVQTMRRLDDRFWRGERQRPSKRLLKSYDQRARNLDRRDRKDCYQLAKLAAKLGLAEEAAAQFTTLVRNYGEQAPIDDKGRVVLDVGPIPAEFAAALTEQAVEINGKRNVRDAFLAKLQQVGDLSEYADGMLRVRGEISFELARELHALGSALLPFLQARLDGAPTRTLELYVFADRAAFQRGASLLGYGDTMIEGLMDPGTFTAFTFDKGHSKEVLHAVTLHELTHLYDYGVAPTLMPSWYNEGFAETFGGGGTFTWDGTTLTVGGKLPPHRLEQLEKSPHRLAIDKLLTTDGHQVWAGEVDAAVTFYAEAWAFVRFLREGAGAEVTARFAAWEQRIRGAALAKATAAQLFQSEFGADLPQLQAAFDEWLALQ